MDLKYSLPIGIIRLQKHDLLLTSAAFCIIFYLNVKILNLLNKKIIEYVTILVLFPGI
jgi:hypothetical protein